MNPENGEGRLALPAELGEQALTRSRASSSSNSVSGLLKGALTTRLLRLLEGRQEV